MNNIVTVENLREGSHKAFEMLFNAWYNPLCRYANSILQCENEAEDVVQKFFCKLWDKHQQISIHTAIEPYLYRSIHNEVIGAQLTAGFNVASKADFQASAIGNMAKKASVQLCGDVNIADKSTLQISGVVNISDTAKVQISGISNVSKDSKFQLSTVNITKRGRVQIGIVNVRDTADGVSIGLINIVKKGGVMEAGIEFGEFITAAATFRSGIRPFYSILSIGYNANLGVFDDGGNNNWGNNMLVIGAGFGTTIRLHKKMDLNFELMAHNLIHKNKFLFSDGESYVFYPSSNNLFQFKVLYNYRFNKHLKLFVGPTFNLLHQYDSYLAHSMDNPVKWLVAPYNFPQKIILGIPYQQFDFWIGGTIGLKF